MNRTRDYGALLLCILIGFISFLGFFGFTVWLYLAAKTTYNAYFNLFFSYCFSWAVSVYFFIDYFTVDRKGYRGKNNNHNLSKEAKQKL